MKLEELGRRAVASKRWRWLPGMLILGHGEHRAVIKGIAWPIEATNGMNARPIAADELPDLSTPATLGCLLHLVREAYSDARITLEWDHNMQVWSCGVSARDWSWTNHGAGDTEAKALVVALEAAP